MNKKPLPATPWTLKRERRLKNKVPGELRQLKQWVVWKRVWDADREDWKKVPFNARTGKHASTTNPDTWSYFETALRVYRKNSQYNGVGFVFGPDRCFTGIDLDHCRDPKTGKVESWAMRWLKTLNSYTEISPSGTGLKVICRARRPGDKGSKNDRCEAYDHARYFTVTGRRIGSFSNRVETRYEEVAEFVLKMLPSKDKAAGTEAEKPEPSKRVLKLKDREIIVLCKRAKNQQKFLRLWRGAWEKVADEETWKDRSASAADGSLICLLAYYTKSPKQLDRLYRKSKLYREKWEREDYRNSTMSTALKKVTAQYIPTPKNSECISNLELVKKTDDKKIVRAVEIDAIRERTHLLSKGWPRRCGNVLFVNHDGSIRPLDNEQSLFAWLHETAPLRWSSGQDSTNLTCVTKPEFYQHLVAYAKNYESLEEMPHEPSFSKFYYAWTAPQDYTPTGKYLQQLLDFFDNPEHELDPALIKAAFLTPAWGGPPGKRPAIVIVSPDRGYGKSTLADTIGLLYGGYIEFVPTEASESQFYTRLLSPDALTKRVVRLDNLSGNYGSKLLESFVTMPSISGHRMYHGEGRRPNTLTTVCTGTAVKLSRDLADRAFFIRLRRPVRKVGWDDAVIDFVEQNRDRILADVLAELQKKPAKFTVHDRWVGWTVSVLAHSTKDVDGVLKLNSARRGMYDEEREDADSIWNAIQQYLKVEGKDDDDAVFIPSLEMTEIIREGLNEPLSAKAVKARLDKHIGTGQLKGIVWQRKTAARGYLVNPNVKNDQKRDYDAYDAYDASSHCYPTDTGKKKNSHTVPYRYLSSSNQDTMDRSVISVISVIPGFRRLNRLWKEAKIRKNGGKLEVRRGLLHKRHKRHVSEEN